MKILIAVKSVHNENTLKIAEAMSEVAPATVCSLESVSRFNPSEYDIIGLGSGIYYGKHDKELFEYVHNDCVHNKYFFVFSTSGSKNFEKNNGALVKFLEKNGKTVLGSFGCRGLDKYAIFKLFGGKNKNHPDTEDFENAQHFMACVMQKYGEAKMGY